MEKDSFRELPSLLGTKIIKVLRYSESENFSFKISDGSSILASYWRLIKKGRSCVTSFDEGQKYGLPQPIDSATKATEAVADLAIAQAKINKVTGDIEIEFSRGDRLQLFSFTSYEDWQINFPNGATELSNYAFE
jgi:hypothetical protein